MYVQAMMGDIRSTRDSEGDREQQLDVSEAEIRVVVAVAWGSRSTGAGGIQYLNRLPRHARDSGRHAN